MSLARSKNSQTHMLHDERRENDEECVAGKKSNSTDADGLDLLSLAGAATAAALAQHRSSGD
jgi:hypothetical protein